MSERRTVQSRGEIGFYYRTDPACALDLRRMAILLRCEADECDKEAKAIEDIDAAKRRVEDELLP
jgi:hypothetical protein